MPDRELGLAEVIAKVRDELTESFIQGKDHPEVRFEYESVEVDFEVAITNELGGSGGVKVWVISAESQAKHSSTQTHHVKVVMTPLSVGSGGHLTQMHSAMKAMRAETRDTARPETRDTSGHWFHE